MFFRESLLLKGSFREKMRFFTEQSTFERVLLEKSLVFLKEKSTFEKFF